MCFDRSYLNHPEEDTLPLHRYGIFSIIFPILRKTVKKEPDPKHCANASITAGNRVGPYRLMLLTASGLQVEVGAKKLSLKIS